MHINLTPRVSAARQSLNLTNATVFATPAEITRRLEICSAGCKYNRAGKCSQCACGGQPLAQMARFQARRCPAGKW